jgi:hypothetical protein
MKWSWYGHLPGVALEGTGDQAVGPGRLAYLPFADWQRLDPTFPWADSHYDEARPVFFVGEADLPDDPNDAQQTTARWIGRLHLALLLHEDAPLLPAPTLSVMYLRRNTKRAPVWRYVGPLGREWIVFARAPQLTCDDARLSVVRFLYAQLERAERNGFARGLEASLHALTLTMRPEFWFSDRGIDRVNQFIHSMAAIEQLLLPPKEMAGGGPGLTVTFGRHTAVLTGPTRPDLGERADELSSLYRLRSRLIHGETGAADLEDDDLERLWLGTSLFRFVLIRVLALGEGHKLDDASLPAVLARAWLDPDAHASLFESVDPALSA